jgi:hypothetical protein
MFLPSLLETGTDPKHVCYRWNLHLQKFWSDLNRSTIQFIVGPFILLELSRFDQILQILRNGYASDTLVLEIILWGQLKIESLRKWLSHFSECRGLTVVSIGALRCVSAVRRHCPSRNRFSRLLDLCHTVFIWVGSWQYFIGKYGETTVIKTIPWSIAVSLPRSLFIVHSQNSLHDTAYGRFHCMYTFAPRFLWIDIRRPLLPLSCKGASMRACLQGFDCCLDSTRGEFINVRETTSFVSFTHSIIPS